VKGCVHNDLWTIASSRRHCRPIFLTRCRVNATTRDFKNGATEIDCSSICVTNQKSLCRTPRESRSDNRQFPGRTGQVNPSPLLGRRIAYQRIANNNTLKGH
jgi:hypothetical protein